MKDNNRIPSCIGFIGDQGAGKDHCCDFLAGRFGYKKVGFSDPLYEQLAILNPFVRHLDRLMQYSEIVDLYGVDAAKRLCPEIRSWLQKLGEECGRRVHGDNCWIKNLNGRIWTDRVVIRDVRHVNEIDYIRTIGGIIIWVAGDYAPPRDMTHTSERLKYAKHADYLASNFKNDPSFIETRLLQILGDYANGPAR